MGPSPGNGGMDEILKGSFTVQEKFPESMDEEFARMNACLGPDHQEAPERMKKGRQVLEAPESETILIVFHCEGGWSQGRSTRFPSLRAPLTFSMCLRAAISLSRSVGLI